MKFPSKVTPYKESSIARFPIILKLLEKSDMSPIEMYSSVKKSKIKDMVEFVDILDCLFAMGKIEVRGELLHYVD